MLENQDFRPAPNLAPHDDLLMVDAAIVADATPWEIERSTERRIGWRGIGRWAAVLLFMVIAVAALGALFAPYVYASLYDRLVPHQIVTPGPVPLAKGAMVDDYWAVQKIDAATYAIGEPRYYQGNYAYLIVGRNRALLFDSGSGTRDIGHVVAGLTKLPVTVIPSHLHYDHIGGIAPFASVGIIDLPETRADVVDGRLTPGRYEYLGFVDRRAPPSVRVTEWLKPGTRIDLGGRSIEVIHTPGHTASSVSLFDPVARQLFAGDFIYPTILYAALPGGSLSAYQATAARLLATLPGDTMIWSAHCCRTGEKASAPWLTMADMRDLDRTLTAVEAGRAEPSGFYPRIYPVNNEMTLGTAFPWNNR